MWSQDDFGGVELAVNDSQRERERIQWFVNPQVTGKKRCVFLDCRSTALAHGVHFGEGTGDMLGRARGTCWGGHEGTGERGHGLCF